MRERLNTWRESAELGKYPADRISAAALALGIALIGLGTYLLRDDS